MRLAYPEKRMMLVLVLLEVLVLMLLLPLLLLLTYSSPTTPQLCSTCSCSPAKQPGMHQR